MEEDDSDKTEIVGRQSHSTSPSIYRSTSNLNKGSQQTIYYSVRNTMYEDALSEIDNGNEENVNCMTTDDESCTGRGTEETIIDGSCQDVRADKFFSGQ